MDKLSAITAFLKVAELRSFTAASASLGMTSSAVTKSVARLEQELGVQLLHRSTRGVALTDEGALFSERCQRVVDDLAEAEALVAQHQKAPRGRLRVFTPVAIGRIHLVPALPLFLARYPELNVELCLTDQPIDVLEEEVDLWIMVGEPADSRFVARRLTDTLRVTCAAPAYLARHGRPASVTDLREHNCLGMIRSGRRMPWRFASDEGVQTLLPTGSFQTNNGDALREAALAGLGIVQSNSLLFASELGNGTLEAVLTKLVVPGDPISVLYSQTRHVPPRMRSFIDFLLELFAPERGRAARLTQGLSQP